MLNTTPTWEKLSKKVKQKKSVKISLIFAPKYPATQIINGY